MLVDVPDETRLEKLKLSLESKVHSLNLVVEHVVLVEQITDKRIADIVVFTELCDEVCAVSSLLDSLI